MLFNVHTGRTMPGEYKVDRKLLSENMIDPALILGVELEIEGLDSDVDYRIRRCVPGMVYHEDGSLRNNGGEYVTEPMKRNTLEYVLNQFFFKNKLTEKNYSDRCSVHVHANCVDLEISQIRLILCLYQILEKLFFEYIHPDRKNNIFCVPLTECVDSSQLIGTEENLINGSKTWKKYTALNLFPLWTQGSIEFRHMSGTHDLVRIMDWVDIISSLFAYARKNEYQAVINTINNLNTTSDYSVFLQSIFTGRLYEMMAQGDYISLLEDGVIEMKIASLAPTKKIAEPKLSIDEIYKEIKSGNYGKVDSSIFRVKTKPSPLKQAWQPTFSVDHGVVQNTNTLNSALNPTVPASQASGNHWNFNDDDDF